MDHGTCSQDAGVGGDVPVPAPPAAVQVMVVPGCFLDSQSTRQGIVLTAIHLMHDADGPGTMIGEVLYLVLPDNLDLNAEWNRYYAEQSYRRSRISEDPVQPVHEDFRDWLLKRGARLATDQDIRVVQIDE